MSDGAHGVRGEKRQTKWNVYPEFDIVKIKRLLQARTRAHANMDSTTVADLREEIEKQFNIPAFDQRLMFGPSELSRDESLRAYSIRNGDHLIVEYANEADVKEITEIIFQLQKSYTLLASVAHQILLYPVPQVHGRGTDEYGNRLGHD